MHLEVGEPLGDRAPPGQEGRAHPVGLGAEPEVEARRLDLTRYQRRAPS